MIIKSSKKSEIAAVLATLQIGKTYSIQEIIDTIRQVCNHHTDTTDSFKMVSDDYQGQTVALSDLYVDMSYQRRIRLTKIINKLKAISGFDKDVAGSIDVAYRPCSDKMFVWDGLRRCIMVGMCGGEKITAAMYRHENKSYESDCQEKEARFFKIRNADAEKMANEEIFKSMIAYKDPLAMAQLDLLQRCNLDVEGLNPVNSKVLGGLKAFQEIYAKIPHETIIKASKLYTYAWNDQPQVLGYGLAGLATLLNVDGFEDYYDYDDVRDSLREYAKTNLPKTITNPRINAAAFMSIAYNIATKVLKDDNGLKSILLDNEHIEVMESF
jgi:hypothetical protein|tara:strand:+ start:825 stop:1802 length:978 start_codon:yes stop_codon:yes gene_type:complete